MTVVKNSGTGSYIASQANASGGAWSAAASAISESNYRVDSDSMIFDDRTTVKRKSDTENMWKRIERIESVLGLIQRITELEEKYPELKEAGDRYDSVVGNQLSDLKRRVDSETDKYNMIAAECKIMEKLKHNNEPE